ncbi:holin [Streptomyces sp. WAC 01529]|uniref:holin n=1 Tax=Streptomyces sp. WAC 01529 TaxID=2203205 RepID=UPI000F6E3CBD|nr:holin [Streptomyces sp. WAC 01529]AZM51432.1 holin [Streptomyces sp. WAC 01529]
MWTAAFWKATAERAIRTFAQALAAVLVAGATSLLDVAWGAAFATAGLAALLAVLTAIGASGAGAGGPGLTERPNPARTTAPRAPAD